MEQLPAGERKAAGPRLRTLDEVPVTILGKGSSLIGGTIKAKLHREQMEQVLEGFLPHVAEHGNAAEAARCRLAGNGSALRIGCRRSRAIWRDFCASRHRAEHDRAAWPSGCCPTHVLFNGGVMHAPFVRERLLDVLNGWLRSEGFRPCSRSPAKI